VAVLNYPVFIGLRVGSEGLAFHCLVVNVANKADQAILQVLDGDLFRHGLELATYIQPALGPLSALAKGLAWTVCRRHKNGGRPRV
jgi:hypothetical protein